MQKPSFGEIPKERRKRKGWTQEQLAMYADLSARYVQSLEAADKLPSLETVFKISKAFSTSPGLLLDPLWQDWKKT